MQFPGFMSTGPALQTRQKTSGSSPKFAALDEATKALIRTAASNHYNDFSAATKQPVQDAINAVDRFVQTNGNEEAHRNEAFDVARRIVPMDGRNPTSGDLASHVRTRISGWFNSSVD